MSCVCRFLDGTAIAAAIKSIPKDVVQDIQEDLMEDELEKSKKPDAQKTDEEVLEELEAADAKRRAALNVRDVHRRPEVHEHLRSQLCS